MSEFFISIIIYNKVRSYIYAGLKYFLKNFLFFLSSGLKNLLYKIKVQPLLYVGLKIFLFFYLKSLICPICRTKFFYEI